MTTRSYKKAICDLNTLQSGYKVIDARRAAARCGTLQESNFERVKSHAEKLDIIQSLRGMKIAHVTGTKGKGSTCIYLATLLQHLWRPSESNLKIGLYTSPHLVSVRERIQINGKPISEELFAEHFFELWETFPADSPKPTYTAFLTLLAFHVFIRQRVDAAVIEAVVGGRYDSTNIIDSPVAVGITPVGMDHVRTLGPELEDIARHKAGIFKKHSPVFSARQSDSVRQEFKRVADERQVSSLTYIDMNPGLVAMDKVPLPLRENASLAYAMFMTFCRGGDIRSNDMPAGVARIVEDTQIPGRFQRICRASCDLLLDGAHTPESIELATGWARKVFAPDSYKVLVFHTTRDIDPLLRIVYANLGSMINLTLFCSLRVRDGLSDNIDVIDLNRDPSLVESGKPEKDASSVWNTLGVQHETLLCSSIESALRLVDAKGGEKDQVEVLVIGSLHLVGGFLDLLTSEGGTAL